MRNPFGRSLAGRLQLYSLAVVVPLIMILGGIIVYQTWVVRPQMVLEEALAQAEATGHQVDDFMTRTGKMLAALAYQPQVEELGAEEAATFFRHIARQFPEYENFFLTDVQGRTVASAEPAGVEIEVGDRPYFQQALSTGQMAVSDVLISRRTGKPTVVVAYPVEGPAGQVQGVLGAVVDLGRLPLSLSRVRLQQEYRLTVFDRKGQMVFQAGAPGLAPDPSQCTRCHAAPVPAGPMLPRAWIAEDQFHGLSLTSLGWHVVLNAPASAVLGTVQREAWGALALVVAILLLSLGVASFLGHRIAGPIVRLAEAARRFGAGEPVEPLPVSTRDEVGALTRSFNDMVEDIGEGQRRLEERQAQLATLHALDRAVSSTLSLPAVLDILAQQLQGLAGVDGVAVFLLKNEENLTLASSGGLATRLAAGDARVDLEVLAWQTLQAHKSRVLETPLEPREGENLQQRIWCLAAPLASKGQSLGAILFCTRRPQGFSPEEMDFLSTVALQVSTGVENARLYEGEHRRAAELEALTESLREHADRLQRAHEGMVETLNLTLQAKDPYTKGHADRVGLLARRMARRLGLPLEKQEVLARAARLHDIGKISVPEHLLSKKGPLTPPERAEFQLHPERSAELLRHLPDLGQVLPAIRGHHERWDGKGYPNGLAGEEIPLEARIIAVADGYDALTTDRPYRPALSHQEALGVLQANAGTQWDPKVVQALLDSFEEEGALEESGPISPGLASSPGHQRGRGRPAL